MEHYIGNFRRQVQDGEVYIEHNHPAIVQEEIFWQAYDHLKDKRPDGKATGRNTCVRYQQSENCDARAPLLKPVSPQGRVYWGAWYNGIHGYKIIKRKQLGLLDEHVAVIDADVLETAWSRGFLSGFTILTWITSTPSGRHGANTFSSRLANVRGS